MPPYYPRLVAAPDVKALQCVAQCRVRMSADLFVIGKVNLPIGVVNGVTPLDGVLIYVMVVEMNCSMVY